jgi:hypothetical protein
MVHFVSHQDLWCPEQEYHLLFYGGNVVYKALVITEGGLGNNVYKEEE